MTRFAIDAGVLLAIVDGSVAVHPSHQLVAPTAVRSEALAALYAAVRNGELDRKEARARLVTVAETKIRLLADRGSRDMAWRIAEKHGFTDTFEAEYAAICRLQADAFVTLDQDRAARFEGVVPLASTADLERPA